MKLYAVVAEHNLPFHVIDHILSVIQLVFHDCEISKSFWCKRPKSTRLVYDVMAPEFKKDTTNEIRHRSAFSLIIDKATDIDTSTHLAFVIKYFNENSRSTNARLLALMETKSGKATDLFHAIHQEFQTCKLEWET